MLTAQSFVFAHRWHDHERGENARVESTGSGTDPAMTLKSHTSLLLLRPAGHALATWIETLLASLTGLSRKYRLAACSFHAVRVAACHCYPCRWCHVQSFRNMVGVTAAPNLMAIVSLRLNSQNGSACISNASVFKTWCMSWCSLLQSAVRQFAAR